MAADSNEKIVIAHRGPVDICRSIRCQQKRWRMRRDGLSGTGFGDDQRRPSGCSAYHYLDRVTDVADRFPDRARKTVVTTR